MVALAKLPGIPISSATLCEKVLATKDANAPSENGRESARTVSIGRGCTHILGVRALSSGSAYRAIRDIPRGDAMEGGEGLGAAIPPAGGDGDTIGGAEQRVACTMVGGAELDKVQGPSQIHSA